MTPKISKKFSKRFDPGQDIRLVINIELGHKKQIQICSSESAPQLNAISLQRHILNAKSRKRFQIQTRPTPLLRRNCYLFWSPNHKDKCIAKGKTCNQSGSQSTLLECSVWRNLTLRKLLGQISNQSI